MDKLKAILSSAAITSLGIRIRFACGAATTVHEVTDIVPALIQGAADLANCCVNVPCDEFGLPDNTLTEAAAKCCITLSKTTARGEGNFNFTANYNMPPGCPYFPAGYNTTANGPCFAFGLEFPDLLVSLLQPTPPAPAPAAPVPSRSFEKASICEDGWSMVGESELSKFTTTKAVKTVTTTTTTKRWTDANGAVMFEKETEVAEDEYTTEPAPSIAAATTTWEAKLQLLQAGLAPHITAMQTIAADISSAHNIRFAGNSILLSPESWIVSILILYLYQY
jgi:hypothetical protein